MSKHPKSNLDTLTHLEHLLTIEHDLASWAEDWDEGFPVGTTESGGGHGKGGHSDRTQTEAVRGMGDHDDDGNPTVIPPREGHDLADECRQAIEDIELIKRLVKAASRRVRHLEPMSAGVADLKVRAANMANAGAGYCAVTVCEHLCSGGLGDKLVSGFCPACYRAWNRNLKSNNPISRNRFIDTWTPRAARNVNLTPEASVSAGEASHDNDDALPSGFTGDAAPGEHPPAA